MPPQFPVPSAEIVLDGQKLPLELMSQLLDVQVRDNLLKPDTAVVRLRDPDGTVIDHASLKVGAAIEVKLGAAEDNRVVPLFKGRYPQIDVQLVHNAAQHKEKLVTMFAGGTPPADTNRHANERTTV